MSALSKTIDDRDKLKARIRERIDACIQSQWSHAEWLDQYIKVVMDTDLFRGIPRWAVSEIEGYRDGCLFMFERQYLEPRWELDGKLYVNGPEKEEAFRNNWNRVKYAGMWYRGSDKCWYPAEQDWRMKCLSTST